MIKGIILDLDGVIVDSESLHFQAYRAAFEYMNLTLTVDQFNSYIRSKGKKNGLLGILGEGNVDLAGQIGMLKDSTFMKLINNKPNILYEDAIELIDWSKKKGLKLAVSTASSKGRELLRVYNLQQYFDVIVTGIDVEENKPAPDIYELCLGRLGFDKDEVLVIEDSWVGAQAALAANLKVFFIMRTYLEHDMNDSGVVKIIHDLDEIYNYF
jgi:beta-phosphoglucomutase